MHITTKNETKQTDTVVAWSVLYS